MTEIRFYHLQRKPLDLALPEILAKALSGGRRVVVRTQDDREAERLNAHLWTWRPDSFLPHGTKSDGRAERQPVWLTAQDENPNRADVLILTGGADSEKIGEFTLCCEMLDGRDETAVLAAREKWKAYKAAGHQVTYWLQTEKGGWEKKE